MAGMHGTAPALLPIMQAIFTEPPTLAAMSTHSVQVDAGLSMSSPMQATGGTKLCSIASAALTARDRMGRLPSTATAIFMALLQTEGARTQAPPIASPLPVPDGSKLHCTTS